MQARTAVGFTLLEALIAISVLVTLIVIGLPSFNGMIERQRVSSAAHVLSTHFAAARSTAVSQRLPVTVCPSDDGLRCRETGDWTQGWILYRDPTRAPQPAATTAVLRWEHRPATGRIHLTSSAGRPLLRFLPDGRSAGTNLRVRICSGTHLMAEVVVNNQGRVRSSRKPGELPCS